jgi:arsenite oxidase small subunit
MKPLHSATPTAGAGDPPRACLSRRDFLLTGGIAVTTVVLPGLPGVADAAPLAALRAAYPRQKIGRLSALVTNRPVTFRYPYPSVDNILVKLGVPAGGGIGPGSDVVAFTQQCSHMGGPMQGTFKGEHQMFGPCPLHLTTFDLTRHGMVVAGHATQSLPQIVLEAAGDDIYAVAVLGLLYGYAHNVTGARRA